MTTPPPRPLGKIKGGNLCRYLYLVCLFLFLVHIIRKSGNQAFLWGLGDRNQLVEGCGGKTGNKKVETAGVDNDYCRSMLLKVWFQDWWQQRHLGARKANSWSLPQTYKFRLSGNGAWQPYLISYLGDSNAQLERTTTLAACEEAKRKGSGWRAK